MTIYFEEKKSLEESMKFGLQNVEYHELRDFLLKDGEIVRARIIDFQEEPIPEWYRLALHYSPQYPDIIPNRGELIKMLARNRNVRKQVLQKLRSS